MKKFNWVAQDADGLVSLYERKPEHSYIGNWWRVSVPDSSLSRVSRGVHITNWKESLIDLNKNDYIIKDGILMATRKHAALIHAWADGADIQFRTKSDNDWMNCGSIMPEWNPSHEYRIKPKIKTLRFRNYIFEGFIKVHKEGDPYPNPKFTRWIDKDWQEVEVEL